MKPVPKKNERFPIKTFFNKTTADVDLGAFKKSTVHVARFSLNFALRHEQLAVDSFNHLVY